MSCFRARTVPENILKKQARDAKLLKALADQRAAEKKARAASRKAAAANATKYAKEYADADKALVEAKRMLSTSTLGANAVQHRLGTIQTRVVYATLLQLCIFL